MATEPSPANSPGRRIYLFTHPRTASHLLLKILNLENQPSVFNLTLQNDASASDEHGYFFLPTMPHRFALAERPEEQWTEQERAELTACFQSCADKLFRYVGMADMQGKDVFVKEHLYWMIWPGLEQSTLQGGRHRHRHDTEKLWKVDMPTPMNHQSAVSGQTHPQNPTVLPDTFLKTWTPTFLIRHPALVFVSIYRTSRDLEGPEEARKNANGIFRSEMTLKWCRWLWEWYHSQAQSQSQSQPQPPNDTDVPPAEGARNASNQPFDAAWPIILDADDLILEPEVVRTYCSIVGLDPDSCRFQWAAASATEQEQISPVERRMKSTILSSSGIVKEGKIGVGLDLDQEVPKWTVEFGREEAQKIEKWVRDAMPDYEFLRARRLKPSTR